MTMICLEHLVRSSLLRNAPRTGVPSIIPSRSFGVTSSALSKQHGDIDVTKLVIQHTQSARVKPDPKHLKFGQTLTDHMLTIKWTSSQSHQGSWSSPSIVPYSDIKMDPSASVFHYAMCCFEGMKAYKSSKDNSIRLFRPELNIKRLSSSARRLAFPAFDESSLLELIKRLVKLDNDWIPTLPGYSLYIRPTMISSGAGLGVGSATEVILYVICSPVGPYYPRGFQPISLFASDKYCRAWPGGSGGYKLGANYPTGILAQTEANQVGYDQVLWLFGKEDYLTEVGTMNLFVALDDGGDAIELVTPPLDDKILPGITRQSALELIRSHISGLDKINGLPSNLRMSERPISMPELVQRSQRNQIKEVFGTGTAAIVSPVERIGYQNRDIHIPVGPSGLGQIAEAIHREIVSRQTGETASDWSVII